IGVDGHKALAIVPVNSGWYAAERYVSYAFQRHRSIPAVHPHVGENVEIPSCGVGKTDADVNLARVEVKAGDVRIAVAAGRDAHGLAQGCSCHAPLLGPLRIGAHDDLRAVKVRRRADVRKAGNAAQLTHDILCRDFESLGVVARQDKLELAASPRPANGETRA